MNVECIISVKTYIQFTHHFKLYFEHIAYGPHMITDPAKKVMLKDETTQMNKTEKKVKN